MHNNLNFMKIEVIDKEIQDKMALIDEQYQDMDDEFNFIAKRIVKLHEIGVPYSEIAILLRKRKDTAMRLLHYSLMLLHCLALKIYKKYALLTVTMLKILPKNFSSMLKAQFFRNHS